MADSFARFVRRMTTGPSTTFRFARANAMFVFLLARELVAYTVDD